LSTLLYTNPMTRMLRGGLLGGLPEMISTRNASSDVLKILSLRGFIRQLEMSFTIPLEKQLERLKEAQAWAVRDEDKALVAGAKMTRGGASVARAVIVPAMAFPLKYDGPKELEALRADKRYWDQRMVRVGQAKVPRTRPIFTGWTADIDISFDPKGIERAAILRYMTDAGQFHGYGTGRLLGFGRFVAQEIPVHRGTTRNRDNGMAVGIAK